MPHPDALNWLIDRYGRRPRSLRTMIDLAGRLPARWDAVQEDSYRNRMIGLASTVLEVADDTTITDKAAAFSERLTEAAAMEIKRFVVYLIYSTLPDQNWPQTVAWDFGAGCPQVYHLETMLEHAEALVLGLLAIHLRDAEDGR